MKPGDLVELKSEEDIVWDDLMFEWDHTLLFANREACRDMSSPTGETCEGTIGTVLECDSNYVRVLVPSSSGWSRKHYWRVIT